MRNFKIVLQYEGTRYQGWQRQDSTGNTIQGKLEDVLNHLSDRPVEIIGAGRTDGGVHARGMVANVFLDVPLTPDQLQDYMNRYLPDDICIIEVRIASDRFHSRGCN